MAEELAKGSMDSNKMMQDEQLVLGRRINFDFLKLEIIDSNIGYIQMNGFFDAGVEAKATARAGMAFLSHSRALIFDLRKNHGGILRWSVISVDFYLKIQRI